MTISLAKHDAYTVLTCTRQDGSVTWQKSGHDGFFGRHDLLHFAVETTLGLRELFFGMVAAGQSIESFAVPGAAATLPAEALPTEMMVNQLMIEHNFGEAADAATFNKVMAACWAGSMHHNAPPPRALTDEHLYDSCEVSRTGGGVGHLAQRTEVRTAFWPGGLMTMAVDLDAEFCEAVAAMDAGDAPLLTRILDAKPHLLTARLEAPGAWLRDVVGDAVAAGGFFERPYLLWFVAEDPVRNGKLPANIADVARLIIEAAHRVQANNFPEQLDIALRLVCWSWIARQCNVQIPLIDVLLDAGASPDGRTTYGGRFGTHGDAAIYNGNFDAAGHLVQRGAPLTLTMALCLNRWNDVARLASSATPDERRNAFVQAAMSGNAEALSRMLSLGVDATTTSSRNQSHATALHHAVWSANLDAVRVLVEAGADTTRTDTIHNGTPLGWAEYAESQQKDAARAARYHEIAAYLREQMREATRS